MRLRSLLTGITVRVSDADGRRLADSGQYEVLESSAAEPVKPKRTTRKRTTKGE
ncbi:DUF7302 family protein [Corynebacterium freneyi]|uniref:DUF7302 family protein n=1 Tax=Corynebacterium freneyi TaxID=134034 RepID=UPI001CCF78BE|nr:hypothetical protein [Corynebacterium freneyi]UBI01566.1 hypothetical protein LA334_08520 [Corynebacterium freneyi]